MKIPVTAKSASAGGKVKSREALDADAMLIRCSFDAEGASNVSELWRVGHTHVRRWSIPSSTSSTSSSSITSIDGIDSTRRRGRRCRRHSDGSLRPRPGCTLHVPGVGSTDWCMYYRHPLLPLLSPDLASLISTPSPGKARRQWSSPGHRNARGSPRSSPGASRCSMASSTAFTSSSSSTAGTSKPRMLASSP
nr:hypothetical protein CFP56_08078 [Quercus suber]